MRAKDKIVIVTGAASGIGKATARLFAKEGAKVICADLQEEGAKEVARQIEAEGGKAFPLKTNVAKYEEVEHLVNTAVEKWGRLDVLVNNAGIGPKEMQKTHRHTLSDWDTVIKVNQTGVFYGMKLALTQMVQQGSGNIVNVASLAGLKASGSNLSYSASKFAVVGMTKSAALEYAGKNIRINAVCPGYTESALLQQLISIKPDMEEILKGMTPMKRFGQTEEIAEAILWLASDQTGFITGQTITIDGGISL